MKQTEENYFDYVLPVLGDTLTPASPGVGAVSVVCFLSFHCVYFPLLGCLCCIF